MLARRRPIRSPKGDDVRRACEALRAELLDGSSSGKHAPEAFLDDPLEQQRRVDAVEDLAADVHQALRVVAAQTGQNTRDIARLKRSRSSAA
jgi:hypothetical protein